MCKAARESGLFIRLNIGNLENVFLEGLILGQFNLLHRKIKKFAGKAYMKRSTSI